mmetsp:Transcript_51409/g.164368  ORF Transcript_51409/g.164368 Transcript_51409/m.164368 type:complete len:378 (-) Transcript_51409:52-1185(-)
MKLPQKEYSDLGSRQLQDSLAPSQFSFSRVEEPEDDESSEASTIYESEEDDYFSEIEEDGQLDDMYGKQTYLTACEELGITPVSQILKYMEQEDISVMHYGIGKLGVEAMCRGLRINKTVKRLCLSDNNLGAEGVRLVVELINRFRGDIDDIDLGENHIKLPGVKEIAKLLKPTTSKISALSLRGNKLGCKEACVIAEAMEQNRTLRYLDVAENKFGEKAGRALGAMLAVNSGLTELNLAWNNLRPKGAAYIAEGITSCLNLQTLNLGWNGIADEGCRAIGEALEKNNGLVELTMSCNNITAEGIAGLAEGIKKNESLASVEVDQNFIGKVGGELLLAAVLENKGMVVLNLDRTRIPEEIEAEVNAEMLAREKNIPK